MNTIVNFETAKLLKEKGFNNLFVSQYIQYDDNDWRVKTNQEYDDLDREIGIGDKIRISAPTIVEVVMWLYEKHKIWIQVVSKNTIIGMGFKYEIKRYEWDSCITDEILYNSPTKAYQEAINYTLKNLIK